MHISHTYDEHVMHIKQYCCCITCLTGADQCSTLTASCVFQSALAVYRRDYILFVITLCLFRTSDSVHIILC